MAAGASSVLRDVWPRCRRWLAGGFAAAYLAVLGGGLFCHTFQWKAASHPLMYWVVWDMFCGWAAHEVRMHVVAEGVSGKFYDVLPGPWTDFHPHGELSRQHYDCDGIFCPKMALNVLRHTEHEEITRLIVIEENWPKKFNMPDQQWTVRWDEPKDPKQYYTLRKILSGEGIPLQSAASFFVQQGNMAVLANPRVAQAVFKSQPFYAIDLRSAADLGNEMAGQAPSVPRFGSPFGR